MENNTFSPARFWKYLRYETMQAFWNQGIGILVFCLVPLIMVAISAVLTVLTGNPHWPSIPDPGRYSAFFTAAVLFGVIMPVRLYGSLTNKREGTAWLLVPASRFEKWLSMMVVTLVVLPLVFILGYSLVDGACFAVFPSEGTPLLSWNKDLGTDGVVSLGAGGLWAAWAYIAGVMVVFDFAAVMFKRSKVAKMILLYFVLSSALSMITSLIAIKGFDFSGISFDSVEQLTSYLNETTVNLYLYITSLVHVGLWGGLTAWRLHTLKH